MQRDITCTSSKVIFLTSQDTIVRTHFQYLLKTNFNVNRETAFFLTDPCHPAKIFEIIFQKYRFSGLAIVTAAPRRGPGHKRLAVGGLVF